jgi:glycosyltransferase involved in cell wall biosynthesis
MPEISVLLCTRNRGDKIKNAVDSILENSYENFELIIVDQSSDDKTKTAIETYSDPRIRYIRSQTVGLSRSRNIAIRESLSEIVGFTDDDCIVDREWLASIMTEFEGDSSVMGVYGRVLLMERRTVDGMPYH